MPLTDEHREAQTAANEMAGSRLARLTLTRPLFQRLMDDLEHRPKRKPLTPHERLLRRLEVYRERLVTAWRVLRGDDIHEDCW